MKTKSLDLNRWLIVTTVMMVAVLEVLDITIINVGLPNMMGELGANANQITWVVTSYIVASAIFVPLTGYFVNRLGQKTLLLVNISGFMISSMLCGSATALLPMVIFRILQGAFGAALIPMSQAILRDSFSLAEQGKAMAIWGIGILAAPVLGPTLGGYIIEVANWRWLFYLNLPFCLIGLVLTAIFIQQTPRKKINTDWLGLMLMAVGIGCLQLFLDQGNDKSWFESNFIISLLLLCIASLAIFIIRGFRINNNIIHLRYFANYNFTTSTILLMLYCAGIFGVLIIQPLMLENLMGYPAITAGYVMAPRGIAAALAMVCVIGLMKFFSSRTIIAAGIILSAYGTYLMSNINLQASIFVLTWPGIIQGFGMGLFFVPLSAVALAKLPKSANAEASGLYSYGRMLGTSIGISLISTLITRETQINWNQLGSHINAFNPNLTHWLNTQHLTINSPLALQQLSTQLSQQASIIAFVDSYWVLAILFALLLPLVFCLEKVNTIDMSAH